MARWSRSLPVGPAPLRPGMPRPAPLCPALLLAALCPALALHSCRTLDLEAARLKRIEAVRGQILSKLRLGACPRCQRCPRSVPGASSVPVTAVSPCPAGDAQRWRPTARSLFFVFNATRLRAGLGRAELSRAELRMLRQGTATGTAGTATGTAGTACPLCCPQGFGNSSWRYLQGRSVRVTAEDEWLWFDVTDSVQQWLRGSGEGQAPNPQNHQNPQIVLAL
ncbi:PREDICTED: transforming growth factor beta-1 [Ficedula albicollis]|uniref:transforming growth factor beta-1 n=1 Tax=Ficedula albicollis TaxID=59894 RepID=UPI0007AD8D7E|nr:PREDICTED: transforming growth factor beta-1 [Ficedula albicollis]